MTATHTDTPDQPRTPRQPDAREERTSRRALLLRRLTIGLVVTSCIVMLAVASYAAVAIRQTQLGNRPTFEATKRAATAAEAGTARIEECTTPGRPCFDDGQKRTGALLGGVYQVQVASASYAAACAAKGLTDADRILACVLAEFEKQTPNPLKPGGTP